MFLRHLKKAPLTSLLLTSLIALPSWAYLTVGESADVTPKDILKIGIEPQIRMSEGSGTNLSFFLDSGLRDDLSWRALIGTGETDLVVDGSIKWVPIPDLEDQPAIGVRGDLIFGREANESFTTVRVVPLVSKQMQTDYVLFTPYVALPLGLQGYQGRSTSIAQLALGSDIKLDEWKNAMFNVELGANLNNSFSYLSFNAVYLLGENKTGGFRLRTREN